MKHLSFQEQVNCKIWVKLSVPVSAAAEVDLLEESDRALEIADNAVRLDFRPFEIKTIKLQIRAAAKT